MPKTARRLHLLAGITCLALVAVAFFFQFVLGLEPCPLCVLTRLIVMALAIIHIVAFIHNPGKIGQYSYGVLSLLMGITGLGVSIRHVWIQNLPPDQVPACGPSFDYLVQNLPLTEVLQTVLSGDGECAKVTWTFLGGSIPVWMIVAFSGLIGISLLTCYFKNNKG